MLHSNLLSTALASFQGPFDWMFDNFLFRIWPGAIFARSSWESITNGIAIGLSLVVAALLLLDQRARATGVRLSERKQRRIGILLTALGFLLYFDFFNPNTRYTDYYHRHELYHYYLGSKYSGELGYKRLYACTAIAEVENGRGAHIRTLPIRDLAGDNLLVPTSETYVFQDPEQCKSHFSPERWQAFKSDVAWFEKSARGKYWDDMRIDHGYNPPPVWTMTGKLFASIAPPSDAFFKLLASIDVLLQLGVVLLLNWAFGWRVMTLATVFWGCNLPANFYWTGGAFLRHDWLFFFIASVCLARKRYFALSGAALVWSSLLRIFPIVAFAGVGLIVGFHWLRQRSWHKDHLRFVTGAFAAGCLLVGASIAVTGLNAYPDFITHIRAHRSTPLTNNMGLEMILAHDWTGRMAFTVDDRLDDNMTRWMSYYAERSRAMRPVLLAISLGVLGWMAWALSRIKLLWIGMILSIPLLMSLLCLTCYYYAFFLAPAALTLLVPALGPAYVALAAGSLVLSRFYWIDDEYTAVSYLFYAFGLCMLYVTSRPLRLAAVKAWWLRRSVAR
jgi:hypothetical protein